MANKNQILVFIVSFLIAGFFLLFTPEAGFSGNGGPEGCCQQLQGCLIDTEASCSMYTSSEWCEGGKCVEDTTISTCVCPPPIPTLNQWGMIIMAGVLGLFAVIGLLVMRRSSIVKPSG